jgi:Zn-dependent peptidase ImmA (M78 family)/DNA-binding XRE family transcriptional regulator
MPRSPEALVEPSLLESLRISAGFSLADIAQKIQTTLEKVESWENGHSRPSMPKLRKLAQAYKRPISDFYLPRAPEEPAIPHDFRRLPDEGAQRYSPVLRYEIRQAYRRRAIALDLAADVGPGPQQFRQLGGVRFGDNPEGVGTRIRELLKVSFDLQRRWREPRVGYNAWRKKIEEMDILVFQVATVNKAEMLGFSLAFPLFPVIAVNRKVPPNGRTFTLMHELVHLLLEEGGVCDIEDDLLRPPREQSVEVFCNHVAGSALVPSDLLLAHHLVAADTNRLREWSDDVLDSVAKDFCVSEEVVLRRLLINRRTTPEFYNAKRRYYAARLRRVEEAAREVADAEFRRNTAQDAASNLGSFARLVLASYHADTINLTDASKFLGVKAEKVETVGQRLR